MKLKFNTKINFIIILSIILSIFCIFAFIFNFYKSNINKDFENLLALKNGKSEIEFIILDENENKNYLKLVNSYDEVNKILRSRIFYKQNENYNEITDIIYSNNDLYLNIQTILNNLKDNKELKNILTQYYSEDEVINILELFKKDYNNKYLKLNIDNLGLSNLIDSYNLLNENHFKIILKEIINNFVSNDKTEISSNELIDILNQINMYISNNKNELFNILIENSLYLNEKEFVEKPFFYKSIIEQYSNEIIDNKSDLILLLQNNQNFITKDICNFFDKYFYNLNESIKKENISLCFKNNKIEIKKNEKDFININIKLKDNFDTIVVPSDFIDYFDFLINFKEEFYSILGFNNNNNKNNNFINSEWVNELNIDSVDNDNIKKYILDFNNNASIDNYYYPIINETNNIYELSLFNNKEDKNNYILISFEENEKKINVIEKLLSQKYDFEEFKEYRLNHLIKFSEKYERLFKSSLNIEVINKLFDKLINSNETYVSEMIYNNNGYVYISFNKIDKTLILRVIECNEN